MKEDVVIRVENLSKVYPLRHPVEDEFGNSTQEHWALKDVSFEIKRGESVGIIGPNGSGKSTLLKILAGVTKPTSGSVQIKGRVASILDIGAGFHPELSGRENVFLNGQIHGFAKKEIEAKLDEIIKFSGIEKFIDEPVKNYSNGMYLRLAFSIMAHLDFDVYLLDEVLSVGDAEFRERIKSYESNWLMKHKTFLKVSQSAHELVNSCTNILLYKDFNFSKFQSQESLSMMYEDIVNELEKSLDFENEFIKVHEVWIDNETNTNVIFRSNSIKIKVRYSVKRTLSSSIEFACRLSKDGMTFFIRYFKLVDSINLDLSKQNISEIEIPGYFLNRGFYIMDFYLGDLDIEYFSALNCLKFQILSNNNEKIGVIDPVCIRN